MSRVKRQRMLNALSGCPSTIPIQYCKLRCILNYFDRLSQIDFSPTGSIIFTRQRMSKDTLPELDTWLSCDAALCQLYVDRHGSSHEAATILDQEPLEMNYRSGFSGGGILVNSADLDELRLSTSPELLACLLFMEKLGENESILIRGTEQLSLISPHPHYMTDLRATTKRDICGNLESATCMIGEDRNASAAKSPAESVLTELNKSLVGFRFCEESRVHGRCSTVIKPDLSVDDDDEFFSATESPDRSDFDSPITGYSTRLSSLILSDAIDKARFLLLHGNSDNDNNVTVDNLNMAELSLSRDNRDGMNVNPPSVITPSQTKTENLFVEPDLVHSSILNNLGLHEEPASLLADSLLRHTIQGICIGDSNMNVTSCRDAEMAADGDSESTICDDETSYMLNGFATSLADNVLGQVVNLVINRESGLSNVLDDEIANLMPVCAKCRLKRRRSSYTESDAQTIQQALLNIMEDIPDRRLDSQKEIVYCKCSTTPPIESQNSLENFAKSISSTICQSAFDSIMDIETGNHMQVVAGEFVDTLICGVAQDVINDNFDRENYEQFCTEIYSSATSEYAEEMPSYNRRLERSSNLDCSCTISVSDASHCESCDSDTNFNSSMNDRANRRLLNQLSRNRSSINDSDSIDLHSSHDWIHESIPEESEVPYTDDINVSASEKKIPLHKIFAKKLFGAAGQDAQEKHRHEVLHSGYRRCSEPTYNLTHIKPWLMNANRRQTLPVSRNIKEEDNLKDFAHELLAWMDRHEKKLTRMNGSYTYRDVMLLSFDEQLKKSSESIPFLEILETSDRGSSRRSSSSGFRDFLLASFEEELVNTSFEAENRNQNSSGNDNSKTDKFADPKFAACCHNFPSRESRESSTSTSTPQNDITDIHDICVTCNSPLWDNSSVCSYEDACDITYRELECFAYHLTTQILPLSIADAAAVLKSRSQMGVKSHKRPICCVCCDTTPHPQLFSLVQWAVASYVGAPSLLIFTSNHPYLTQLQITMYNGSIFGSVPSEHWEIFGIRSKTTPTTWKWIRHLEELRDTVTSRGWSVSDLVRNIIQYGKSAKYSVQASGSEGPTSDRGITSGAKTPHELETFPSTKSASEVFPGTKSAYERERLNDTMTHTGGDTDALSGSETFCGAKWSNISQIHGQINDHRIQDGEHIKGEKIQDGGIGDIQGDGQVSQIQDGGIIQDGRQVGGDMGSLAQYMGSRDDLDLILYLIKVAKE